MKRISILIASVAVLAGGCVHDQLASRLANAPNHCQLVRGDSAWLSGGVVCAFDNPLDDLSIQAP